MNLILHELDGLLVGSTTKAKGDAFERVARWIFKTAPLYRSQLKEVWLWSDFPKSWGKHAEARSYLSELLDIVNGTGRRLSAVCKLTFEDLRLDRGPHWAIRWPANTDKIGRETVVPISAEVRRALDRILRERPGIGGAPIFPSPGSAQKPISRHLADRWLREAERLAKLEPQQGSLWHAYRRKWATERKHHPDVDVAAAGGWKTIRTLKDAYQQADAETMFRVVTEPGELREAR